MSKNGRFTQNLLVIWFHFCEELFLLNSYSYSPFINNILLLYVTLSHIEIRSEKKFTLQTTKERRAHQGLVNARKYLWKGSARSYFISTSRSSTISFFLRDPFFNVAISSMWSVLFQVFTCALHKEHLR